MKSKEKEKLYECGYCYKKKMKGKNQVCSICRKVFGFYVITVGEIKCH